MSSVSAWLAGAVWARVTIVVISYMRCICDKRQRSRSSHRRCNRISHRRHRSSRHLPRRSRHRLELWPILLPWPTGPSHGSTQRANSSTAMAIESTPRTGRRVPEGNPAGGILKEKDNWKGKRQLKGRQRRQRVQSGVCVEKRHWQRHMQQWQRQQRQMSLRL